MDKLRQFVEKWYGAILAGTVALVLLIINPLLVAPPLVVFLFAKKNRILSIVFAGVAIAGALIYSIIMSAPVWIYLLLLSISAFPLVHLLLPESFNRNFLLLGDSFLALLLISLYSDSHFFALYAVHLFGFCGMLNIFSASSETAAPRAYAAPAAQAAPRRRYAAPQPQPAALTQQQAIEMLERYHQLKEKGIITEEEFQMKKRELLFSAHQ